MNGLRGNRNSSSLLISESIIHDENSESDEERTMSESATEKSPSVRERHDLSTANT